MPEPDWIRLGLVGACPKIVAVRTRIAQFAPSNDPILITGEPGTGKEVVARACHALSPRGQREMVCTNLSSLSMSLIESELFGYVKGAFTGANAARDGRLKEAHGSTLFLDEVGTYEAAIQIKLLRVVQDGRFEPVGCNTTVPVDIRWIAATNTTISTVLRTGDLRRDLYARLSVHRIDIPPLRERREDLPVLAQFFLEQYDKRPPSLQRISPEAIEVLRAYHWPDNVRGLRNVIRNAIAISVARDANAQSLPPDAIEFDQSLGTPADHNGLEPGIPQVLETSVCEQVACLTLDLLLRGDTVLAGIKRGSTALSPLLGELAEGTAEGLRRYFATESGAKDLQNLGQSEFLSKIGVAAKSTNKGILVDQVAQKCKAVISAARVGVQGRRPRD